MFIYLIGFQLDLRTIRQMIQIVVQSFFRNMDD